MVRIQGTFHFLFFRQIISKSVIRLNLSVYIHTTFHDYIHGTSDEYIFTQPLIKIFTEPHINKYTILSDISWKF